MAQELVHAPDKNPPVRVRVRAATLSVFKNVPHAEERGSGPNRAEEPDKSHAEPGEERMMMNHDDEDHDDDGDDDAEEVDEDEAKGA